MRPPALAHAGLARSSRGVAAFRMLWAMAVGLCAAGCSKTRVASTAPPTLGPAVVEVSPAARSVGVPYDVPEVWARFTEPVDSTTVTVQNVFLKLDTRRVPGAVRWDAATGRVILRPAETLRLAETYTVELRPGLKTATGTPLGKTYWWQFTVTGVRRLEHPYPAAAATARSPYTPLTWDRTEASAGEVRYELYASEDSAAVASRSIPPLARLSQPEYFASGAWSGGTRHYWAVTTLNATLGEREHGPVWRFDTAPAGAPIDSVVLATTFWGYTDVRLNRSTCGDRLSLGAVYQSALLWDLAALAPGKQIAWAIVRATSLSAPVPCTIGATRRAVTTLCDFRWVGPLEQPLANSQTTGPFSLEFSSETMTAHVAAMHHGLRTATGYTIGAAASTALVAPLQLVIHYYR